MPPAVHLSRTISAIEQIEKLVMDVPGWSPIDQLYTLFSLGIATADLRGDMLEVGSWCGRSAIVLALAAKASGNCKVHCVDLFPEKKDWHQNPDGSFSFEVLIGGKKYGGYQGDVTVWKEAFEKSHAKIYERYEGVLDCFQETVASRGMDDVILPHKGDLESLISQSDSKIACKLVFLDGAHDYKGVREDILNADRCLIPGGWICFDDAFSSYEGVDRAISELILGNPRYECTQQMTRKLFVARKKRLASGA